jgi:hypothetical protein
MVVLALAVAAPAVGCVNMFWRTEARPVARPAAGADTSTTFVRTPVKAHLADGSTVMFASGARIGRGRIAGAGKAYALLATTATARTAVPLDSVVGLETFEGKLLAAPTVVVSAAATAVGAVATVALLKAIFGSCPTVYADSAGAPVLQAEGFSYAIAPLLEHRDLDPLRVRPGADGIVRLELRNEALETHLLNHVELVAVRHPAGARVVPDQRGRPAAVGAIRPLDAATDRLGRDVRALLAAPDGQLFASAPATVSRARVGDLDDWIDVSARDLPPGDSVAVVLRLRNSLLNTVLLYEGMLGGRDAPQWLSEGLQHIGTAVDLSRWYVRTMGMHASVEGVTARAGEEGGRSLGRLGDVGPLAFRDVAIVLPRPARDARAVRVRLRFVADNWRIDHAAIAATVARPESAPVALSRVVVPTPARGAGPFVDSAALGALGEADGRYLETQPGQRILLEFAASPPSTTHSTTYLIAWQGWYREWIRGSWLAEPTRTAPFVPGDSAVSTALTRWRGRRGELERAFYASRVPVR